MDRSEVIYLVAETNTQNAYGVLVPQKTERKVYCNVRSVTGNEWLDGGRIGLNPEYRMTMFKYDYEGEKIIKYKNIYYSIYRTYETRNDFIELYVERRQGSA